MRKLKGLEAGNAKLKKLLAERDLEILTRLMSERGAPAFIGSDNGPEFVSLAILKWVTENRIDTVQIDPGKPWQNGTNESLNGRLRDECLNAEWFPHPPQGAHPVRGLAAALQRRPAALQPELLDPNRIQLAASSSVRNPKPGRPPGISDPKIGEHFSANWEFCA